MRKLSVPRIEEAKRGMGSEEQRVEFTRRRMRWREQVVRDLHTSESYGTLSSEKRKLKLKPNY